MPSNGLLVLMAVLIAATAALIWHGRRHARLRRDHAVALAQINRLRPIVDQSGDVTCVFNGDGVLTFVSANAAGLFGAGAQYGVGKHFSQSRLSSAAKTLAALFLEQATSRSLDSATYEIEHALDDGESKWLQVVATVLRDDDSAIDNIIVRVTDVTQRHNSEEQLRIISENVDDVIYIYDTDGIIRYVSPSIERMLGVTPAQRIGKSFLETAISEEARDKASKLFALISGGELTHASVQIEHILPDDRRLWGDVRAKALHDSDGALIGVLTVVRDITRRREAQDALRESEAKYRTLAERSLDPILSFDAAGTISFASPAAEKTWKLPVNELLGKHYSFGMPEDSIERAKAAISRLASGATTEETLELQHQLADGSLVWNEVRAWPIVDGQGAFDGFQFLARDITERLRTRSILVEQRERLTNRARELLHLNEQLDRFSVAVSHDMQGPLRRTSQHLSSLRSLIGDSPEALDNAIAEVHDLQELVDHLLNLTQSVDAQLSRSPVDICALLEQVVERLSFETGVAYTLSTPGQGKVIAQADEKLLRLLLANVSRNAFKYGKSDRHVTLTLETMTSTEHGTEYRISDRGPGFDDARLAAVFDHNVQGAQAGDDTGYGIGLATVANIVHRHGGRVYASNRRDGGALIAFTLGETTNDND
ncbi:MAG: PAS domain-containing sensor histidine kinase [Pseudomonadota bacterium]